MSVNAVSAKYKGVLNMITKDMIIGDLLDEHKELAPLFFEIGMHCLGCPSARGESVEQACAVHGVDADEFVARLNDAIGA